MSNETSFLATLTGLMGATFNKDELKDLCLKLGIDYEELGGNTKSSQVSGIVMFMARRNRLSELLSVLEVMRENIMWPAVPKDFSIENALEGPAGRDLLETNQSSTSLKIEGDQIVIGDVGTGAKVAAGRGASIHDKSLEDIPPESGTQNASTNQFVAAGANEDNEFNNDIPRSDNPQQALTDSHRTSDSYRTGHIGDHAVVVAGRENVAKVIQITTRWLPVVIILLVVVTVLSFFLVRSAIPKQRRLVGEWNVAVAQFSTTGDQAITEEEAAEISMVFFNHLENEMQDLADEVGITIDLSDPNNTGEIKGESEDERAENAKKIANDIKADLIIYGTAQRNGSSIRIQPEFFVDIDSTTDTKELVGQHAFGNNLVRLRDGRDPLSEIRLNRELSRRAQAMALITRGITFYVIHEFQRALEWFEQANDTEALWQASNEGREVVFQLEGNSAKALYEYDQASKAYQEALKLKPNYARAMLGIGDVFFLRALEGNDDGTPGYNDELLDQAMDQFQKALMVENQPPFADIPAKSAFYQGQVHIARWLNNQSEDDKEKESAEEQFQAVISAYDNGSNDALQEFASEAHARIALIESESSSGNYTAALNSYISAYNLAQDPSRQGLYAAKIADLYLDNDQEQEAAEYNRLSIDHYEEALSIELQGKPEVRAGYHAAIAMRYLRLEEFENAVSSLERAVQLLPEEGEFFETQLVLEAIANVSDSLPDSSEWQLRIQNLKDHFKLID